MPINTQELMNVLATLSEQQNLRVAVKESFKGGCIAGAGAMVGGMLLGPPGLAIGGIVGACSASVMARNKFRPVAHIILYDMTPRQQQQLATSIRAIVDDFRVEDAAMLLPLLLNNPTTHAAILSLVTEFITREMRMNIID
ncbi:protein C19orf12 homolog isoform X2 [Anabrus simplex]